MSECAVGAPPPPAQGVELVPVFEHANLKGAARHRLVDLVESPWTPGEWYLVQQHGRIFRIHEDASRPGTRLAFDMRDDPRLFIGPEEAGLTSLAFHPSRREAYIVYTAPTSEAGARLESRLSRFQVRANGNIDPASEEQLLTLPQPRPAHSGDQVLFGPDGKLYFSAGDGGLPQDGGRHGQDPHTLYGALSRLDVDAVDEARGTPYAIPADNPFADGVDGAPEVFAYGFRNPWRFSFDRATGELWLGDVGENDWEEINRVVPGGNYGWSIREGHGCLDGESCASRGLEAPFLAYDHDDGISVIGGMVYRGGNVPALQGRYVYADYIYGTVWSVDAALPEGAQPDVRVEAQAPFWISSFAESTDGELYLLNFTFGDTDRPREGEGGIYRLAPATAGESSGFPKRLSETRCFNMDDHAKPATGMLEYTPRSPLWSDGARKERFLSLPEGARIDVKQDGDFAFPEGTILVKSFGYGERLHETRLLVNHEGVGWRGYSYRWNDAQTEATLLDFGENEVLADGAFWRYPSRTQCDFCHTEAAGFTLGLEGRQLDFAPNGADNQLDTLFDDDLFVEEVTRRELRSHDALVDPLAKGDVETRARSYLHANCSLCHRPKGPTRVDLDMRFDTPLARMGLCGEEPTLGTLGGDPEARRLIAPGDPDNSVLLLRMQSEGGPRMPPLGTQQVDEQAAEVVRRWIESLTGCP